MQLVLAFYMYILLYISKENNLNLRTNMIESGNKFEERILCYLNYVCWTEIWVSRTLFIIPNDAHNYKIIGILKTIKIPTFFGSRRNHHQGAISCLTKTTIMIILCSSLMTWSMLWRHTSLLCKHAVHGRGRHWIVIVCISWNNK